MLMKSLQMTLEFESGLTRRFATVQQELSAQKGTVVVAAPVKFSGSVSSSFENYLHLYIEAEDK